MSDLTKNIASDVGFKKLGETKHGVAFYGAISEEQLDFFAKKVIESCIERVSKKDNGSGDEWDEAIRSVRADLEEFMNEQKIKPIHLNEKKLKP